MKIKLLISIVATYICLSGCMSKNKQKTVSDRPNIIFILADDLGYGDLGCYGQEQIKTPFIDNLARSGMRFTNHYAGSTVCAPSRCSLMTGKHTGKSKIRGNKYNFSLESADTTVAQIMQNAGYKTAIIGKWGLGDNGSAGQPSKKGFDYFVGYLDQIRAHNAYTDWLWKNSDTLKTNNKVKIIPESYAKGIGSIATEKNTHTQDIFTNEALSFIENNKTDPFFLYLSYTLPHANNEAWYLNEIGMEVPELMGYDTSLSEMKPVQQAFAASVSYLDRDVGKIISKLKELGIDNNTLVIFASDNGPHEEGGVDSKIFKSSGSLRGIKRDLYEGGIRVPMIAYWPGKIAQGSLSMHASAFWDFLPTACNIAGVEPPKWTDGISYYNELLGKPQKKHEFLYWEWSSEGGKQAVRLGNWKGVRLNASKGSDAPIELYNLSKDIGELKNIAEEYPLEVSKISEIMKREHTYSKDFNFDYEID
ncbi:arylsulfatase [Sabulilitoribacter arenilitoris]|uniref:Arylsulfatase n=1 Tax=Wocania arenilitoris TaxID=2044858 RepID=A0AAE3JKH6_9FLAO|nr:arylsulfatase [Wocania arenilitoris]MCF7567067.1 arylsulfatase [Wocania arenilitoris]